MRPIYVDLDDVLSETTRHCLELLNRNFGKEVCFEDVTHFDFKKSLNLTQGEYDYLFELIHQPEEILRLNPIKGAVEVLSRWSENGYKIFIVTGRLTSTYEATLEWLSLHQVPYHSFLMVDKYSRPNTDHSIAVSWETLSKMPFHSAIEDSSDMARRISEWDTPVMLFDRPWNRSFNTNDKVSRVASWKQIEEIFKVGNSFPKKED